MKQTKTTTTKAVNEGMKLCEAVGSEVNWKSYEEEIDFGEDEVLMKYGSYYTDPVILNEYLNSKNDDGSLLKLAIPIFIDERTECLVFNIEPSNTLSPELQKKYGSIKTFKGQGVANARNTIRLEYTKAGGMKGYINIDDKAFLFMPYKIGNETIYLCYSKSTSGRVKFSFEK